MTSVTIASCGFHPTYGVNKYTSTGVEEHLASIDIAGIPNREGLYLRNELIDRFYREGRPSGARYTLDIYDLRESKTELDITKDADATRGQLKASAKLKLRDNQNGEVLLERNLASIASYNILTSEFTNRVSEQNARENTLRDLARQAEQQLALYFKRKS